MITKEDTFMVVNTSVMLGIVGSYLVQVEDDINNGIDICKRLIEEIPDEPNCSRILDLFVCAKNLLDAHKVIIKIGEMGLAASGTTMIHEGPGTVQ
jgi:hypothetical protein